MIFLEKEEIHIMMKLRSLLTFSAIIMALSLASFTGANAQSGTERAIEQQVRKKILSLPNYGVFDIIKYDVDGTRVTLTGKVHSLGTTSQAVRSVKRIKGVTEVVNNIDNLPASMFDDEIRIRALRTFNRNGLGQYFWEVNPDVRIIVENGRMTLEGYVYNKGDRDRLNIYANGISGVFAVTNNLIVGRRVA